MKCEINKNILISFILIVIIISFTGVASYEKFITSISKKGIIETAIAQYCEEGWNLKECLIRSDSHQELNVAKSVIASRSENVDFSQIAGKTKYTQVIYTKEQNPNYDEAYPDDLTNGYAGLKSNLYYSYGYEFDEETGLFDLVDSSDNLFYGNPYDAITIDSGNKKFTCFSMACSNCTRIYVLYNISKNDVNGDVTFYIREYDLYSQIAENVLSDDSSGMFIAVDDYTNETNLDEGDYSYYYRGAVNNNWVKFGKETTYYGYYSSTSSAYRKYAILELCENSTSYKTNCTAVEKDIYWMIVRINGNGSVRLIYSGQQRIIR